MLNFNEINQMVADNEVVINGKSFGMLTDVDAEKLIGIIKGMQSGNGKQLSTTTATKKTEVVVKPTQKADSKDFPDLGKPAETVGFCTLYNGGLVRYWENGFVPDKVKYGIKMSLKDAGAVWDKANGAFKFTTKKAANEWLKAQKARQSK